MAGSSSKSVGSGGFDWPRQSTTVLINLYEEHPCLYLPIHPDYHNRNARQTALQEIVDEFNGRMLTNITIDDVKKKIHGIKTQYLAELKKIKNSEESGVPSDEVYTPKLWCFELLHFLKPGTSVGTRRDSILNSHWAQSRQRFTETKEVKSETPVEVLYSEDVVSVEEAEMEVSSPQSEITAGTGSITPTSMPVTKKRKPETKQDNDQITGYLSSAVATLQSLITLAKPEHQKQLKKHHLFGEFVADEMEDLEDQDLINSTKQAILVTIFEAKEKQRIRKEGALNK